MNLIVHKSVTAGAKENAGINVDATLQTGSAAEQLKVDNMIQPRYASLEPNSYRPAAPRKLYRGGNLGVLTSVLSGADGVFPSVIGIKYTFDKPYAFNGLTIFSRDPLKKIGIGYIFSDDTNTYEEVTADTNPYHYNVATTDCKEVIINITSISEPERFLQVWDVEFGTAEIFSDNVITSVSITKEADLSTRENPASTLELTVLGARDVKRNDNIDVYKNDKLCYNFYIDKISYDVYGEPTTEFTCYSYIQQLTSIYYGGVWTTPVKATQLLDEIFTDTGLSYEIDLQLKELTVTGYIPLGTRRDGLLYVAAAIGAIVDDSTKTFNIVEPKFDRAEQTFDETNIVKISKKIETGSEYSGVDFTQHVYSAGMDNEGVIQTEGEEIYKSLVRIGETQFIEFSEPIVAFLGVVGLENEDGEIVGKLVAPGVNEEYVKFNSYGANYISLTVKQLPPDVAGLTENNLTLRLIGFKYVEATTVLSKRSPTATKAGEVEKISDMTLIASANSIANYLYGYYQRQNNVTAEVIADNVEINTPIKLLNEVGTVKKITDDLTGILQIEVI